MTLVCGPETLGWWKTKGIGIDPPSTSVKTVHLKALATGDTLDVPVYTNTKVHEVKGMLAYRLGVDPDGIIFTHKQGSHWRQNHNHEEIDRQVNVTGIRQFAREKTEWPHPHCIIGAGHIGLKMAMTWLTAEKPAFTNFVLFDRRPEVGGTSWHQQANKTTRLQTEVGVYHLQYHEDNIPPAWGRDNPWPSKDTLLKHFKDVSEEFGVLPYCKMNTDVAKMNIHGKDQWMQQYELELRSTVDKSESMIMVSSIAHFPGNLTNPKKVVYKGEHIFDGEVVYGISSSFDYGKCTGNNIAIIGSGAFSVENIRTVVEHRVGKIYHICRRKTLAMPRIVSWLINQSAQHISAALTLEAMAPMYDLIGIDQWAYYAVYSNESRTNVTIRQKSRFGIGDVYFLAMYYGLNEHIVDDVKRVSCHKLHLMNGRTLENVMCMLKLLGFNGEFENDRLLKTKELYGWWVNKDMRRYVVAEPLGVDANNFGGTSFSPGAIMWAEEQIHMLHFPADWGNVQASGSLPIHVADESIDRPAYVVEARHGSLTGISIGSMVPGIGERGNVTGPLGRQRMWELHPAEHFLKCCELEWYAWSKTIHETPGYEHVPEPKYPYSLEIVQEYLEKEQAAYAQMEANFRKRMEG